jgi:hypothetical protein
MRTKLFAWVALMMALSVGIFSQTLGDVSGAITDSTGGAIPGVTVTITNTGTNAARSIVSNDAGLYSFPGLVPGSYSVKAEKQGFKGARAMVEVQVQDSKRVDITMETGDLTQVIDVVATGQSLTTENATVGTVIENKRIVELPINGRNYLSLVALAPNVSFGFPSAGQAGSRQGGDRAGQSISVAGMRNNYNRFTLDGVENTDPNFNSYVVLPSVEALQEFKVQSGVYPAEFGRGATQINVATKAGSNQYHGTLFEFLRNDKLDAKNYAFTANRPPKDPFKWNQYGFMFSGPVQIPKVFDGKNKLFFMTNYEWFRQRRQVQSVFTVPSDAMRGGNFSEIAGGVFDPNTRQTVNGVLTGQQFPGNIIPQNRLDATSRKLLEFLPNANVAGTTTPTGPRNNRQQPLGRPINKDQFTARMDWTESSKSSWFGRYSKSDENQLNEGLRLNGVNVITDASQWMTSNTRVLSPTLVNEFRFGYTKFYNTTGPELAFSRDVVSELAIPGLKGGPEVQWGIPGISINNYSFFGNDSEGPYENNNSALQFINNMSIIRGKHTIKVGGEIRRDAYNQVGNQFARGQFTFNNNATRRSPGEAATGDSFADFMIGHVNQAEAAVSIARAQFRQTGFAFYIDDSWKFSPKLTISLGLRYENTPPWQDQTGTLFNGIVPNDIRPTDFRNAVVQDRSLYPFFMRQSPSRSDCYEGINIRWVDIATKCDGSLGSRLVGRDNNDFAPRVGFSYSPTEKWVVRFAGGMFYSQDTGNPRFDMARNLAGRLRDNSSGTSPNLLWSNSLAAVAGGIANIPRPYTFANPFNRQTPLTYTYLLNLQRELTSTLNFEVGYMGSQSRQLESLRAVNETLPAPRSTGLSLAQRSPFPNFGRIQLVDNDGRGNYNSLGAKLTKRLSGGLTLLTSYTWSKSIDTASAIRNQGGDTLFPQNSYCRICERALSSFDTRHRLVVSTLYALPVGRGRALNIDNGFANALIGGWELGSIFTMQSGFPITVTQGGDPSNTGGQFDRPISAGVSAELDNPTPSRWFNQAAFIRTPDGSFGNVGRNTLTSPGIFAWDFQALKNFKMPFAENHNLQFRFEAFNLPNHPVWGNPDTNFTSSGFGVINSTRTNMRNLQLALRYTF